MSSFSGMEAWRAAEIELCVAVDEFRRVHLDERGQHGLEDARSAVLTARNAALQALHDALVEMRRTMSGGLWDLWNRRALDFERRIHVASRRATDLEQRLAARMAGGEDGILEDAALRSELHLLGLIKYALTLLLEHPRHAARLTCRSPFAPPAATRH